MLILVEPRSMTSFLYLYLMFVRHSSRRYHLYEGLFVFSLVSALFWSRLGSF